MKNRMKRIVFSIMIALLLNMLVFAAVTEPTLTSESLKISDTENLNYWLFTPKNATANMPLIVYLHGGSGKGDDINTLTANGFCQWASKGDFDDVPAYIIFPQLSSKYQGWNQAKGVIKQLVEAVSAKYQLTQTESALQDTVWEEQALMQ